MITTYAPAESNMFDDIRTRVAGVVNGRTGLAVCDVGGGAHPFFSQQEIDAGKFRYTLLDISHEELANAADNVERVVCDVTDDLDTAVDFNTRGITEMAGRFDIVFTVMLAEHLRNAEAFHRNVLKLLVPGGSALHLFPTLYSVPYLINLFLPEPVAAIVNRAFSPTVRRTRRKFPAYYRWCRGPTVSAIQRLERIGAEVIEYRGYFGHNYYERFSPLNRIHQWKTEFLERYPMPLLTNYALVWYRKPEPE